MASISKGDRVKIVRGRKGTGVTGEVFWLGPDKFDREREKAGVHGDDGEKYWVYADYLQVTAQTQAPSGPPRVAKGDRVTWRDGRETGEGTAFWVGQNKQGPGYRVGVATASGDKKFLPINEVVTIEPYTVYGTDPDTWRTEPWILDRSIDVRFVRALKPAEVEALAELVAADLRADETVLTDSRNTAWWLPLAAATHAEALAAAQAWLDAVHDLVPIADAIFYSAPAGDVPTLGKRPQWQGLLQSTSPGYKALSECTIFKDVRARLSP